MSDLKKLFQRDKMYLICLAAAVGLIILYGILNCYDMMGRILEIQNAATIGGDSEQYAELYMLMRNEWILEVVNGDRYLQLMGLIFGLIMIAQIVKWHVLEGKNGKEFQSLLPIKSSSQITYDFICGILLLWLPAILCGLVMMLFINRMASVSEYYYNIQVQMVTVIAVFSLLYSMLVFAKKVTNNIPGAIFVSIIILFTVWVLYVASVSIMSEEQYKYMWDHYTVVATLEEIAIVLFTVIFIFLAYWCDKKRDIAGNGVFSFKVVHFLVIAAVFVDMMLTFYGCDWGKGQVFRILLSVLLASGISIGLNFLVKSRSI